VTEDIRWHADKRVPVALILAIALQFAGFIWYASKMDAAISANSKEITKLTQEKKDLRAEWVKDRHRMWSAIEGERRGSAVLGARLSRIEANQENLIRQMGSLLEAVRNSRVKK
jgi:hypothetical protein